MSRLAQPRSNFLVAFPGAPLTPINEGSSPAVHADCFLVRRVGLADYRPAGLGLCRSNSRFLEGLAVIPREERPAELRLAVFSALRVLHS